MCPLVTIVQFCRYPEWGFSLLIWTSDNWVGGRFLGYLWLGKRRIPPDDKTLYLKVAFQKGWEGLPSMCTYVLFSLLR